MRIAIADDNKNEIELLKDEITACAKKHHKRVEFLTFCDGDGLFLDYKKGMYDALFLDIEMPGRSGMEIARQIRKDDSNTAIIFVTQMMQYAVESYRVNALDYLVKPVMPFDLDLVFSKLIKYLAAMEDQPIIAGGRDTVYMISKRKLIYVEVRDHYLHYHTVNEDITVLGSLSQIHEELSGIQFYQCSRYCIVNLKFVTKIEKNILVCGDVRLEVSRKRRRGLMEALNKYIGAIS